METVIFKYLYWCDIRYIVQKQVSNCHTLQCTIQENIKYGKLPANVSEEI